MAKIFPLFSGSSGNSTYIGGAEGGLLVDAGRSATGIIRKMENAEISVGGIRGIFVTHNHIDHISGLKLLQKKLDVPVFASKGTADALSIALPDVDVEIIDKSIEMDGFRVERFDTPHDCSGSCGYRIELSDGLKFAVCTDLGHVTDEVRQGILGCDAVLIESNHDVSMLQNGPYPFDLKQRVIGDYGHLSNGSCAAELPNLLESGTTRIILGHISRRNNTPDIALSCARSTLVKTGAKEDYDYILRAASPDGRDVFYLSR